jgi:hypothetical protein
MATMIPIAPTLASRNTRPRRMQRYVPASPLPALDPAPPERERLSPRALVRRINSELRSRPECADVRVGSGRWQVDDLADDCNWSEASLVLCVCRMVGQNQLAELARVIAQARERYDVDLPEAYLL